MIDLTQKFTNEKGEDLQGLNVNGTDYQFPGYAY